MQNRQDAAGGSAHCRDWERIIARRADRDPPLCIAKMAQYAFGSNAPYGLDVQKEFVTRADMTCGAVKPVARRRRVRL
jgi:hypothetical protein